MTEAEWLQETNWKHQFEFLADRMSLRKQRLAAAGFCRRIWDVILVPEVRLAVEIAEKSVDGHATVPEMEQIRHRCREVAARSGSEKNLRIDQQDPVRALRAELACDLGWLGACITAGQMKLEEIASRVNFAELHSRGGVSESSLLARGATGTAEQQQRQHEVFLDLVGNPFRPVVFDPAWRTSTTLAITASMLETGDFRALPILADALEDAGCESDVVLRHCRGDGPHFRGCWVVDGILGKS